MVSLTTRRMFEVQKIEARFVDTLGHSPETRCFQGRNFQGRRKRTSAVEVHVQFQ